MAKRMTMQSVWAVLGWVFSIVLSACASGQGTERVGFDEPAESDIRKLFAAELHADPWFVPSSATETQEARRITAMFRTELVDVRKHHCRATVDRAGCVCTFEVVLRFPNMLDRESRSLWERRFYLEGTRWVLLRAAE